MNTINRIALALSVVVLTGCGGGGGPADHGDDFKPTWVAPTFNPAWLNKQPITQDVTTYSGVTIYETDDSYLNVDQIELMYIETEMCTGIWGHGPNVSWISFSDAGMPYHLAVYTDLGATVQINLDAPWRSYVTDEEAVRHEFVHHLLTLQGASYNDNHNHGSPFFNTCTAPKG